jgi:hypothetical protein
MICSLLQRVRVLRRSESHFLKSIDVFVSIESYTVVCVEQERAISEYGVKRLLEFFESALTT